MRIRFFILTGIVCFLSLTSNAQFVYKIKADSVKITNDSCTAELILENSTKNVQGFLYNKGNGRTEFRKGLIRINDSLYIIGGDTLNIAKGVSESFIRNQNAVAQAANFRISGTGTVGETTINGTFAASTGTIPHKPLNISPVYIQTGTATGNIYGVYYDPTVTSVLGTHYGLYINSGKNYFADKVLIGGSSDAGTKLQVSNAQALVNLAPSSLAGFTGNVVNMNAYMDNLGSDPILFNIYGPATGTPRGSLMKISDGSSSLEIKSVSNSIGDRFAYIGNGSFTNFYSTRQALAVGINNPSWFDGHVPVAGLSVNMNVTGWGGASPGQRYVLGSEIKVRGANPSGISYGLYVDVDEALHNWGIYSIGSASKNYFQSNVLIGTTNVIPSSKLTIESTTQGFLPPRMTTAQRDAIASPVDGLEIYNTTTKTTDYHNGTSWVSGNYIQNQIASIQPASFRINGAGLIEKNDSSTALSIYRYDQNGGINIGGTKIKWVDNVYNSALELTGNHFTSTGINIAPAAAYFTGGAIKINLNNNHQSYRGYGTEVTANYSSTNPNNVGVRGHSVDIQSWSGAYGYYANITKAVNSTGETYAFYAENGKSYFNDLVGIGTTSPQYKLDVNGISRFKGDFRIEPTGSGQTLNITKSTWANAVDFNTGEFMFGNGNSYLNQHVLQIQSQNVWKIWGGVESAYWKFYGVKDTQPLMTLKMGDQSRWIWGYKMSIGGSTEFAPQYTLDVTGTARIGDMPFTANRDTILTYDPSTKQLMTTKLNTDTAFTNGLYIRNQFTSKQNARAWIDSLKATKVNISDSIILNGVASINATSGELPRLWIGTNDTTGATFLGNENVSGSIHLYGVADAYSQSNVGGVEVNLYKRRNPNASFIVASHADPGWSDWTYDFKVNSNGANVYTNAYLATNVGKKVGIGTYAPEEKLHVAGNARIDGFVKLTGVINLPASTPPTSSTDTSGTDGDLKRDANGNLYLKANGQWLKFTGVTF